MPSRPEEWLALAAETDRYAQRTLAPAAARHERPMDAAALARCLEEAEAIGLAGADGAPSGLGPWEGLAGGAPGATLELLARLSRANTGAAFAVHQRALGRALARRAGVALAGPAALALQATHGLGGPALARALAGAPLAGADRALLEEAWAPQAPRLLLLDPGFAALVAPAFVEGAWGLRRWAREELLVAPRPHGHGLDELLLAEVRPRGEGLAAALAPEEARALAGAALAADSLGLVALAAGALERAQALARAYAAGRRQGGSLIDRHALVLGLLGRASAALRGARARLDALADAPFSPALLAAAWALRAEALPALCEGARAALQVFGGLGYMRETGPEKVSRDLNCLRASAGSPPELLLLLAEQERLEAAPGAAVAPEAGAAAAGAGSAEALDGHVPPQSALSPRAAFARLPRLVRALVAYAPEDPWEQDTAALPAALARVRRRVRAFADAHLRGADLAADARPHGAPGDPGPEALEALRAACRAGLLSDLLPAPFGSGDPRLATQPLYLPAALKTEELAAADGGLMLLISAHALGVAPVLLSGDLGAVRRFALPSLRACARGEPHLFAFAITEPSAGSDVEEGHGAARAVPGTVARRAPGGFRLSGRKCYISGGDLARQVVVFAALEGEGFESWCAFVVPAGAPGFSVVRTEDKMGMRASGAAELLLEDVFVPDDHLLGRPRDGWAINRAVLNMSRIPVAAMGVGFARAATEAATAFACGARLGGRPLVAFQEVQAALAQMQAETSAARAMVWAAARRRQALQREASAAKFHSTEVALRVCEQAMDLMGNHALLHERRVEKAWRDARLTQIFEGTNQINRLAVVEDEQERLLALVAALAREAAP